MCLLRSLAFRGVCSALVVAGTSTLSAQSEGRQSAPDQDQRAPFVHYRDFGAKGDGKTDDFEALVKAHEYANRHGLPVKADDRASYYIGGADRTIIIQTDTDFGSARFIIDDRDLKNFRANVFEVRSSLKATELRNIKSLKRNQPTLEAKLPGSCVITVTNSGVKRFIRRGLNRNDGSPQTDVFLVDKDGHVDPKTPIIWDFDRLTQITALPVDETTLFITGGKFTTIANDADFKNDYHSRGIGVRRSKVLIKGLEHRIEGEGKEGAPYRGFINISECTNVIVKDTVLTGHKTYTKIGNAGKSVPMGSYDISITRALNVSLVNCSQTNDIMDSKYWGIIGTNFCKNLIYDGCKLSRFDAHQGVTNAEIRNSTLGYMGVKLTGSGTFLIENTTVRDQNLITFRQDYGSTWHGDIIIRKCRFIPSGGKSSPSIFGGFNDGQHDFGYPCHMPTRILIDGLDIADPPQPKDGKGPTVFENFNPRLTDHTYKQKFPYIITQKVVCKNITSSKPLRLSDNAFMFRDVETSGLDSN